MTNFKGIAALVIALIAIVGFMLWIPALKYVFLAACVVGVVIAFGLRAWHARKPVKDPEEDSVKLHLND
jgi:TM2 domain-containing membrane protein YozV